MSFAKICLIGLGVAGLLSATNALAAKYGAAGCGLGSVVMGPSAGFSQVFAATTNGTSYSQIFGITTGTSNCEASGQEIAQFRQQEYINSNLSTLAKEASQGEGETLEGLANVFGCSKTQHEDFSALIKTHYSEIFSQPGAEAILERSREIVRADEKLAESCSAV